MSREALQQYSSVSGNTATLVVPSWACPVQVSFTTYRLPSGEVLPFEDQVLYDNATDTYGPGTYHLTLDAPTCAYQSDLYLGELIYPLTAGAHHNHNGTNYLIKYDLTNLGQSCEPPPPPPPPPGGECVECGYGADDGAKAAVLTLTYSGAPGIVTIYRSNKVNNNEKLYDAFVNTGDVITIDAATLGKDDLGAKVGFYLGGVLIAEIHTSCSDVLRPGTTEANQEKGKDPNGHVDFTVVSGVDKEGNVYCDDSPPPPPPPPPPPGGECVECGFGANDASRIGELTLRYLGPDAHVTVYDHKLSNNDVLFDGDLVTGQLFTVYASTIGEDRIGPKILLYAADVFVAEIHTSCSAPITAGLTEQTQPKAKDPNGVADFEIVGGRDSRGKELCGSDVCAVDQGPPQIMYSFESDRFIVIDITDDTGIATIDIELEDVGGAPTSNLELVESDFTPDAMTARFKYRLINFTQNTFIRVVATDLCDQQQCPDTDQFPDFSPLVVINGQGDFATGYTQHPDGLQSLEFFRLNNVAVTQNTFVQGNPRADFTVTRLDSTLPTRYGLIAATSCNATVIDPDLDYSGTGARGDIGMASVEVGNSLLDAMKGGATSSEATETALPGTFSIGQNYPNPFRASTTIGVELPEATDVLLEVYNLLGQRIATVADGLYEAGSHTFSFDARDLPSGTYIYRIVTPESSVARRMVVLN